jgi:predicted nucleic acid-binding protein
MPFVLDTSVAMAWCFEDEVTRYADRVLDRLAADAALVPPIWPLAVANVLCVAERRQRLRPADSARFTELLRALPITVTDVSFDRATGSALGSLVRRASAATTPPISSWRCRKAWLGVPLVQ